MIENLIPMLMGVVLGVLLLGVGIIIGVRLGKRRLQESGQILSETDREQMLQLLQQLGSWTSEYSGSVSGYQDELGKLSEAVKASLGADGSELSEERIMGLLAQIMKSNEDLQGRLEAAERQLDKQTQQIEVYLTEARTDGLTRLFNRRAFDKKLDDVFNAYRNGGRSFALVLVDIDKFKSINDTHGHQAGDKVLQQMAATLRSQLSGAMIVARFGGEEFAVIVEGPLKRAAQQLDEVRRTIASEPMNTGTKELDVTVSIGVSEPRDDLTVSTILRRSDEALYAAKNMGRNRVYYHDGRAPTLVGAPEIASS